MIRLALFVLNGVTAREDFSLSLSRDRADRLTVWSKGGRSFLAVDFKGELGTDGRVTVDVYPHIEITDVQRL